MFSTRELEAQLRETNGKLDQVIALLLALLNTIASEEDAARMLLRVRDAIQEVARDN